MKKINPLSHQKLQQRLHPSELNFKNTTNIKSAIKFLGQERALKALLFGLGIKSQGYNLYAMGPTGIGKRSLVTSVIKTRARREKIPPDWCYIYNFSAPEKPIALQLPAGLGFQFQKDMQKLIDKVSAEILSVYESDEFRSGMKKINHFFDQKKKKNNTESTDKIPPFYIERYRKEKLLQLGLVASVIEPIVNILKKKYKKFPTIIKYLSAVQKDILHHISDFVKKDEETDLFTLTLENVALTKYKVNLLVDNKKLKHAPIIMEENPTYFSLNSRVEHTSQHGSLVTNFTLIRAGALHKANGGYLLIEARKLNIQDDAWEALKNALYSKKIKIEPAKHVTDSISPVSLEPMPIPLNLKIILLGDRNNYYIFCDEDPDFLELFKVPVDFNEELDRNKKNIRAFAKMVATFIQASHLKPFLADAVAEIINYSTRLAEDNKKLSMQLQWIKDLILEADYWAGLQHKKMVNAKDVKKALQAKIYRMDRSKDNYYEDIYRNFIIVNTDGKAIGQVNCLSVRRVGNFSYGHPTRVTARVRLGKGKLVDIQREIKLAGPAHSKACLIIANFIGSHFNQDQLFAISASIAFEQIYCWTDGDSASVGELCALLSALAEIPIYQHLAVTGSIDQYGEVQAIGGVNEKIEGFYDVCKEKGFNGKQGVLIPKVNIQNLMLRDDVVKAVKEKQFFIYAIETIDDAVLLLMGETAGKRNVHGNFLKDSLYYKIEERLKKFFGK